MSKAAQIIAGEIKENGVITFERFMVLALYCPDCGYYEREEDIIGRRGDYYTNVSVGSLFGELLARQFAEWLEESTPPSIKGPVPRPEGEGGMATGAMTLVEAGAHHGRLTKDILGWMREHRPGLFERLEYWIVEPSDRQRARQQRTLDELVRKVHWARELAGVTGSPGSLPHASPPAGVRGIIFSNELLDAMPVRRLGWDANKRIWYEWGVSLKGERFVWSKMPANTPKAKVSCPQPKAGSPRGKAEPSIGDWQLPIASELLDVLPDGFTVEASPAAVQWWREAASVLEFGSLVTIDYGLTAAELFVPERKAGTLRAYRRHQVTDDVLAEPGEQDITAHVDFAAIREAGEAAGLQTEGFHMQEEFLTTIAARAWKDEAAFGKWTAEKTRQFRTLTHPEHLGRAFRVLVQTRRGSS